MLEFFENFTISTKNSVAICFRLLKAIHQIHNLGWVISNLGPENILVDTSNNEVFLFNFNAAHKHNGKLERFDYNIMYTH